MTKVEQFILENQAKVMMALAVMSDDKELSETLNESAKIIFAQLLEWKAEDGPSAG